MFKSTSNAALRIPSLRAFIIRLHVDLFTIDQYGKSELMYQSLKLMEQIVLILEDRRFFRHPGVDIFSCVRETIKACSFRRHGGASTIDMQFVRTATGYRERTICRKIYEFTLAILIQFRYSKIEILRSYLGCAFFGSHMIGVENAAEKHFKKGPSGLTLDEAAILASLLVYPKPLHVSDQWETRVIRRANYAKRLYPRFKQTLE